MSINDYMNKIKGLIDIDISTLLCLLVVVLVGLSSFGLGRISESNIYNENKSNVKNSSGEIQLVDNNVDKSEVVGETSVFNKKMYVASKNGKLYYNSSCSGGKRILEKNQIWFPDSITAEKSGYKLATSCK